MNPPRQHLPRLAAFTLIEVMVTIGIIVVLAAVLLAVGMNVKTKSQISQTYAQLKTLEGLIDQFEKDNQQSLLPMMTTYNLSTPDSPPNHDQLNPTSSAPNIIDALYAYPATRDPLVHAFGDKLQIGAPGGSRVLDSWGRPICFIPLGGVAFSGGTAASRQYVRSAGPNKIIDWSSELATSNADDILSSEASR
jgi:type II secretory pathway pseudopilin PulG